MVRRARWNIASAKAGLSEVVRSAAREPQVIEKRGEPVAVVVGISQFRRLSASDDALARWAAFLEESAALRAAGGAELELPERKPRPSPLSRSRA